jgi:hypothetical protein
MADGLLNRRETAGIAKFLGGSSGLQPGQSNQISFQI